MILALVTVCSWAYDVEIDGIYYNLVDKAQAAEVTNGDIEYEGEIVIPSSIQHEGVMYTVSGIRSYAFYRCTDLVTITIPNSVKSIGYFAFSGCSGLTSINIPNSLTTIADYAFENCTGLTSITIPRSVTSIEKYAFRNCRGLSSVTIPNSVKSIDYFAFSGCENIDSVFVSCEDMDDFSKYVSRTDIKSVFHENCLSWTTHIITINGETQNQIIIPDNVFSIGSYAFCNCRDLTNVIIPQTITSIGSYAFQNCSGLDSITIPNSVDFIPEATFEGCSGLESITLPFIGSGRSWSGSSSLFGYIFGSSMYAGGTDAKQYYADLCYKIYYIPSKLKNVTITGGSIRYGVFSNCSGITNITIPETVTSIGQYAFLNCFSLTSITIPESVTSIGNYAFKKCSGLINVTIPNSVTTIGMDAFSWCSCLVRIDIPESVTSIGSGAFQFSPDLTCITIPESVISIGSYTFRGCSGLTSITIPNSVTSIEPGTFYECSSLTSITIPETVTFIGEYAFKDCINIETIKCYADKIPTTHKYNSAFQGSYNATLFVPESAIEEYKSTAPWSNFGTILPLTGEPTIIDAINSDATSFLVSQQDGIVKISGMKAGNLVTVSTIDGKLVTTVETEGTSAVVNLTEMRGSIVVLNTGDKSAKVLIK